MNPTPTNPEAAVIGYCRACGRALTESEAVHAAETIFCEAHAPAASASGSGAGSNEGAIPDWTSPSSRVAGSAGPPPLPGSPHADALRYSTCISGGPGSPALAFLLGFIPGVGAVYNGQYAKGFVHVLILGLMISVLGTNSAPGFEPLIGILIGCFVFYMAFDAYHTARRQRHGEQVDEFSGLLEERRFMRRHHRFPVGPIVLIAVGILFLLNNLGWLHVREFIRYWPALLIVMGLYQLFFRLRDSRPSNNSSNAGSHADNATTKAS